MTGPIEFLLVGGGCYGASHTRQLLAAQRRGKVAIDRLLVVDRNPACRVQTTYRAEPLVEVVRSDWTAFLVDYLDRHRPGAQIVPACFAPHLLLDWLLASLRLSLPAATVARAPLAVVEAAVCVDRPRGLTAGAALRSSAGEEHRTGEGAEPVLDFGLPYQHADAHGNLFLSAAAWRCPATCVEPARCPATHGLKSWELGDRFLSLTNDPVHRLAGAVVFTCRHYVFGVGTIPAAPVVAARDRILAAAAEARPCRYLVATASSCHGVAGLLTIA